MTAPKLPVLPDIRLVTVADLSPRDETKGFLRLERRRYRARYPDGKESDPFVYDFIEREALDAVVIAAHFVEGGERHVYLRSALRPPVAERNPVHDREEPGSDGGGLWELPAGLVERVELERGGSRCSAARELSEELGFALASEALSRLGPSTYPAPGIIGERHIYYEVEVDPKDRRDPTLDGSALERCGLVVAVPLAYALEMCRRGLLKDAKSEIALRRLAEKHP
jgi:ADP-ribose pyrophosphatase